MPARLNRAVAVRMGHLRRVLASYGYPTRVTSTVRSYAQQARDYARWQAGQSKYPAAPPGHSLHELGRAFDLAASPEGLALAGSLAPYLGLRWGGKFRTPDVVHFER